MSTSINYPLEQEKKRKLKENIYERKGKMKRNKTNLSKVIIWNQIKENKRKYKKTRLMSSS